MRRAELLRSVMIEAIAQAEQRSASKMAEILIMEAIAARKQKGRQQ